MAMKIGRFGITKKLLRYGRWYVHLDVHYDEFERREVPQANVVWLACNTSFRSIPRGYVIHHLDHDKLNDDISNLVLMHGNHHTAYHKKNYNTDTEIDIDPHLFDTARETYFPNTEPCIFQRRGTKNPWFFLSFQEIIGDVNKRITVSRWMGKRMQTREEAQMVKDLIWKPESLTSLLSKKAS